jgi:hypothetical protein
MSRLGSIGGRLYRGEVVRLIPAAAAMPAVVAPPGSRFCEGPVCAMP